VTQLSLPEVSTSKQLAGYIGTTEAALAQDRYLKQGIPYTKIGKRVRYLREDVVKYLQDNRIGGDEPDPPVPEPVQVGVVTAPRKTGGTTSPRPPNRNRSGGSAA
jgi:hypothetical protein